jgi:hypothetical protein
VIDLYVFKTLLPLHQQCAALEVMMVLSVIVASSGNLGFMLSSGGKKCWCNSLGWLWLFPINATPTLTSFFAQLVDIIKLLLSRIVTEVLEGGVLQDNLLIVPVDLLDSE